MRLQNEVPLIAMLALGTTACAGPELEPAPAATEVPGPGAAATAAEEGVRVEAQVDAWSASPETLAQVMRPVRVEISNGSDRPLMVRYGEFALVESDGARRMAVPPYNIEEEVVRPITPDYQVDGFAYAPYLDPFYDGAVYEGPFDYDPLYYDEYYPYYAGVEAQAVDLPSTQMLSLALPEGVLEPGGVVTGFLYFQKVEGDVSRVSFQADLVAADSGRQFAQIDIPFQVN